MILFAPNEIVKSLLGTKFLILGLKSFINKPNSIELIYDAFNMNLKIRATLHAYSNMPTSFIALPREELPDEEKNFTIEDACILLGMNEQ